MARRVSAKDPDFSDTIRELLNDEDSDNEDTSSEEIDDSDADPDYVLSEEENIRADTPDSDEDNLLEEEREDDSLENIEQHSLPEFFVERMKKKEFGPPNAWQSKAPPNQVRVPARNIIRTGLPGIRGRARLLGNSPSKTNVWKLFFDEEIMTQIVDSTNVKLQSVRANLSEETNKSNYRDTCIEEINALLGLFVLSSVLRSKDEKISSLFTKDSCSRPIFSAVMSVKRYEILTSCIRFDDANTRDERKQTDKAAPISEIFQKFISNSQSVFCVSSEVTVDEMLIPFRGRCSFRVYMPNKPKKYGIKVMCLADAKTSYLLNAYIYTGKGSDSVSLSAEEKKLSIPTQAVVRVCRPIEGSNRNITADNWFTSLEVVDELSKRKLTYVGTVRKDKKLIPEEFLPNSERPVASSLYGFRGTSTLLSFVPKQKRSVVLISSTHHSVQTNPEKKKPEIICYYNKTKCGVDLLDMKCAVFTCSRKTRRWPLAVFYRMINIACVNSFIAYLSFTGTPEMKRFEFIKQLGHELVVPHLRKRLAETVNLPRALKSSIENVLSENKTEQQRNQHRQQQPEVEEEQPDDPQEQGPAQATVPSDKMEKRKTCSSCPSYKKRKTSYMCIACKKAICLECSRKLCVDCAKEKSG